ncbi:MAG TPA: class I SAM-dependent methyltransferase [Methanolinea sp.]|nr:class I SAM-dependent methyltransferase [Methanolinea sp.]
MRENSWKVANDYDKEAAAIGWDAPAIVYALASPYTRPGQEIIDIGIGTGLGSELFHCAGLRVVGLDISEEMLDACRAKGCVERLVRHDLTVFPYPFENDSFDHAVSTGVFQFFENLSLIFQEVNRILKSGGIFVFVTGDRRQGEDAAAVIPPEHSRTTAPVRMFRHSPREVRPWLEESGFRLFETREFSVWIDTARSDRFFLRAYLARKS